MGGGRRIRPAADSLADAAGPDWSPVAAILGVMAELLPATQALLLELLEGLDSASADLPEVRVSAGGRHGSRYWLHGRERKSFDGRRPVAQFDELRAAGYLRKLRSESSGVYYGFTPAAFQLRDELARTLAPPKPARTRPDAPPPELLNAASMRDELQQRADRAMESLVALAEVSGIKTFQNDPASSAFYLPKNPHRWLGLDREHIPLLGPAREYAEAWLVTARLVVATAAPEHLDDFDEGAATLRRVYISA